MIKNLINRFWAQTEWPGRELFVKPAESRLRIALLVRAFYCSLVFFACYGFVDALKQYSALTVDPLWPLFWMKWSGQGTGIPLVLLLSIFGPLMAAWKPGWHGFRILAFIGCLEGMALENSFGKINNDLHLWVAVTFMLIFLPRDKATDQDANEGTARLFWGAQAFILLTYSMSGIAKLLGAVVQIARSDEHTLLSSDALARHVAERLMMTSEKSLLGNWIIHHPLPGWPLFLGAVYLETFAFIIAFRPSLHRLWALGLVIMHIGIFLTMNVTFSNSILLLSLFFFASPSSAQIFTSKQRIRDLPLFGPFLVAAWDAFFRHSQTEDAQTVVFYDGVCGICSRWVAFLLSRKLSSNVRFAPLQGEHYRLLKIRFSVLEKVDALVIYRREAGVESIRIRSEGVFWLLPQIPGWTRWTLIVNVIPMFLLNLGYRFVARIRHRMGRSVTCPVFTESLQGYFLENPNITSP